MKVILIFLVCVIVFILDIFPAASVSAAACIAMVVTGCCSATEIMSGFTNDIVLIIFGTEIFGIAFNESGLSAVTSDIIIKIAKGNEKKLILTAGIISAVLSAFLNNQVVCALMILICTHIADTVKDVRIKNITLPVIYCAVMGGQCTLVGAPATMIASSISEDTFGQGISMFELLPMGLIILLAGMAYIYFISYRKGIAVWGHEEKILQSDKKSGFQQTDRKKIIVTLIAGAVMIFLFITEFVSVGIASVIAGLICIFGGAVKQKDAFSKTDWNILIWLGCSISMASELNKSGGIQNICQYIINHIPMTIPPVILLVVFTLLSVSISNLIANTTTVIMILPFALKFAEIFSLNPESFLIAITMGAGLAVMTPLSSGFIGMTVRVGYRFKEYIRYGLGFQIFITFLIVILTCVFFPVRIT